MINSAETAVIRPKYTALLAVLVTVFAFASCDRLPWGYTPISELIRAPGEYEGKTVKVHGTVTDAVKLPILELRYYTLRDGEAELAVWAENSVPAVGALVTAVGLHLVEKRRW